MKKHFLLLVISVLVCTAANAVERSWQQKRQIALSILGAQTQTRSQQGGELKLLKEAKGLSVLGYERGGFAVISNDDRHEAVLGWSTGKFNADNMPDGLRWWLGAAEAALASHEDYSREYLPQEINPELPDHVDPMLPTVWGQSEPFNLQAPGHYPSGCVATAMAQIMYYHKYPSQGAGYIYDLGSGTFFDFSTATYDYDSMLPDYRNGYTTEQGNAVATLLRHCGAAVYMNYAPDGSGTASVNAAVALRDNFLYHENIAFRTRDYHSTGDWLEMVYGELAADRPILYGAADAHGTGGHAFVFDGYNEDGLVSVNWGWDGDGNGFYDIELLDPTMIGSSFEYSEDQDMVMGIGLPDDNVAHRSELLCNGSFSASYLGGRLTVNLTQLVFYNFNIYPFDGALYLKLTNDNSDYTLSTYSFAEQPIAMFTRTSSGASFSGARINRNYSSTLPDDLPDGTYKLYLAVQDGGYAEVSPMSYAEGSTSHYILTKSGSSVTLEAGEGHISTGIDRITLSPEVQEAAADNRIFTIDGRYAGTDDTKLAKGLYIRNGKKFIKR